MLFLASINHHRIGFDATVRTDDNRAVALAFRGVDTFGDIHPHGTFPRQSSYHFSYHPSHTRSKILMRKRLDGRGGGIQTLSPSDENTNHPARIVKALAEIGSVRTAQLARVGYFGQLKTLTL
jgi:hypothetical protein